MRTAVIVITLLAVLLAGESAVCGESSPLTQQQWMTGLVEGLGWSFGLPDEPETEDFLRILEGDRRLRVEAEQEKQPTDVVSVKSYDSFGDFSGDGWVSGISTPTTAHLQFVLPLSGTYQARASVRLPGHEIRLGGQTFRVDGGQHFTKVLLGMIDLTAGPVEAVVHLPPNGSIDYLELAAPPLPAVRPLAGWEPGRPLTRDDMAVTAVRTMLLEGLLPPTGSETLFEVEDHAELKGARITDISHLGSPSGGRWVRAGTGQAEILITFTPPEAGVYELLLRGEGNAPLRGSLNDRHPLEASFPPYLQTEPIGVFYLPAGTSSLRLQVPSRAGLDALILKGRQSDAATYRRLAGLPVDGPPPTPAEMDSLLSLLAAIGSPR